MSNLHLYQKIFRLTFLHFGIRSFFSLTTAVLMIFIMRKMGPQEFGKFSLVLQLAVTSGLFLSWGSASTLSKFLPELKVHPSQSRLSSQAIEVSLISMGVFLLFFFLLYFLAPSILPDEIKSIKLIFVLFVGLFAIFNVFQGIFRGLGKFVQWSLIEGSNDFIARIFTLLLLLFSSTTYQNTLYCFSMSLLIMTLYSFSIIRKQFFLSDLKIDPKVSHFAVIMLMGSVIFIVGTSADAVLLRALLKDPQEVGYYFAGIRIPQIFQSLLLTPLSIPFLYYFTHPDTSHTREQIIKLGTKLLGLICGVVSLIFFSFGSIIVSLLYGDSYSKSIDVLRIYGFVFFIIGMQSFVGPFFVAINKVHVQMWIGFFSVLSLLALDFLLIPHWKSMGSALANVIMLSLQTISYIYILANNKIDIVRFSLLLSGGMLLSVSLELFFLPYSALPFFLFFVWISRLFSKEEIDKIWLVISSQNKEKLTAELPA